MFDIIGAIKSALDLVKILNSGDNKEKMFSVAMRKNARKALNVAEEIFSLVDDYCDGGLTKKRFGDKYTKLRREFDKLD